MICLLYFSKQFETLIPARHHLKMEFFNFSKWLLNFQQQQQIDRISTKDCEGSVKREEDMIASEEEDRFENYFEIF